jgi:hypothetical protein
VFRGRIFKTPGVPKGVKMKLLKIAVERETELKKHTLYASRSSKKRICYISTATAEISSVSGHIRVRQSGNVKGDAEIRASS